MCVSFEHDHAALMRKLFLFVCFSNVLVCLPGWHVEVGVWLKVLDFFTFCPSAMYINCLPI